MSYSSDPYLSPNDTMAAWAAADERSSFITKTYLHLLGAILLFMGVEGVLLNLPGIDGLLRLMVGTRFGWLVVMALFIGVSYIAENWARSAVSPGMQYLGLGLYVVAEAVVFAPMLYIASRFYPDAIPMAGLTTGILTIVLTAVVLITRKDFSFLRSFLWFASLASMGLIVAAIVFQFALGPIFTYAMVALACGYMLYHTSNVLHHYRIGQHVAASLALFASVALLFWYILQIFMSRRD